MKYKSKKYSRSETISVLKKHWNRKRGFFSNIFNSTKMNSTEMLPEKLPTDSRLTKNQLNKTKKVKVKQKEHSNGLEKVIFIDPGVKK